MKRIVLAITIVAGFVFAWNTPDYILGTLPLEPTFSPTEAQQFYNAFNLMLIATGVDCLDSRVEFLPRMFSPKDIKRLRKEYGEPVTTDNKTDSRFIRFDEVYRVKTGIDKDFVFVRFLYSSDLGITVVGWCRFDKIDK